MLVLRCDDHVLLLVNLPWDQKDSLLCPIIWSFSESVPGSELRWHYEIFMDWQTFWNHFYSDRLYYIRFHWLKLSLSLGMERYVVTNSKFHAVLDVIFVWFISISKIQGLYYSIVYAAKFLLEAWIRSAHVIPILLKKY